MRIDVRPIRSVAALGLAVLVASPTGCGGEVPADQWPSAEVLEIQLTTLEGDSTTLAAFEGRVLLADFWATWCAPCRAQHKILGELYPEYLGQPVEFVAVNVGESPDRVRPYVDDQPFAYPLLLDGSERLANALEIIGLPTLLVVDASGEIRFLRFGVTGKGALRREIEEALGGRRS